MYNKIRSDLEKREWNIYQSMGGKSYFQNAKLGGIVITVDQVNGQYEVHRGAPMYMYEKAVKMMDEIINS